MLFTIRREVRKMDTKLEATDMESVLYREIAQIIEKSQKTVINHANSILVSLFWRIGKVISVEILKNGRADYGKQIVSTLSTQLKSKYGRSYEVRNLRRMIQFYEQFPDENFVKKFCTSTGLSWSHIIEILPLKSMEQKMFYLDQTASQGLSVRGTRKLISRKAFERAEIANTQTLDTSIPKWSFKDPYLFDFLNLKSGFLEKELEQAILDEIQKFILEIGKGFAFVERQKRMIIDGEDFYLDLLFYHRILRRLVAVELKVDKFEAKYKGQMELYLKWLNRYERQEWENEPIGLILCAQNSREQVELLEMGKSGIMVAEYWTALPPKKEFEKKIHSILVETQERIGQKKLLLPNSELPIE